MLKVSDNPPQLCEQFESISAMEGDWWVAHTKARAEKALAWSLASWDIGYFLPMAEKIMVWGGRKRKVLTPIFPSYLFFCGDSQTRYRAMTSNRICQVLPVRERDQLVNELEALHLALKSNCQLELYPAIAVGKRCRVSKGPLEGTEGIVLSRRDRTRLVLQISMLGQGASLEIAPDLLELVD